MSATDQVPQHHSFSTTTLPVIAKQVSRMGIAGNYGLNSDDIRWAADQGANYWLWGSSFKKVTEGLRSIISDERDKHVVAMLGKGWVGWQVRNNIEKALRTLNTDYLDIFKLGWLGRMSFYTRDVIDTLLELKREGKIRAIGTSIHDRMRAGRLALDSAFDLFMIRYNAKHPGAEQDIFPFLAKRNPAIISYTALAWGQLIRPMVKGDLPLWPGEKNSSIPPLTPQLCYRFVLSNQHVHVVLTGPKNRDQLRSNLDALQQGPLKPEELAWIKNYGTIIRNRKWDYVR